MSDFLLEFADGHADMVMLGDDVATGDGLRSTILALLFTDARVSADETSGDRKGWWGDAFNKNSSDSRGSKLWLLSRSKMLRGIEAIAESYIREALAVLITSGIAKKIDVAFLVVGSRMHYQITVERNNGERSVYRYAHLWDGEMAAWDGTPPNSTPVPAPIPPAPAGPVLVSELNFSAPPVQTFPSSALGFAAACGVPVALPSHIWQLGEPSGNLLDDLAGEVLVPAGPSIQGQTAPGLWDGTSYTARRCIESGVNSSAVHASQAFFDQTTGSFAMLVAFRASATSTIAALAAKKNATSGWGIVTTSTQTIAQLKDAGGALVQSLVLGGTLDSVPRYACIVVDRTANLLRLITPDGVTSTDITGLGSLASAASLRLGLTPGWFGQGAGVQRFYLALFSGAAAESITPAALATWWTVGKDPSALLTTSTRPSPVTVPVSANHTATFAADAVAIGYDPDSGGSSKLGLYLSAPIHNYMPESENMAAAVWSKGGGIVVAARAIDGPSGFRDADTMAKTAVSQYSSIWDNTEALSANSSYTVSFWCRRNSGSGPNIEVRDALDAKEYMHRQFSSMAVGVWVQCFAQFRTDTAGAYLIRFRPSPGAVAEAAEMSLKHICVFKGHATEVEKGMRHSIRGGVSAAASKYQVAGNIVPNEAGEIETSWVQHTVSDFYLWDRAAGEASANSHECYVAASQRPRSLWFDSLGAIEELAIRASAAQIGGPNVLRDAWDTAGIGGFETVQVLDGYRDDGSPMPLEGIIAPGFHGIAIGANNAQAYPMSGTIESLRVYDGPRAMAADPTPPNVIGADFWTTTEVDDFALINIAASRYTPQNFTAGWARVPANCSDIAGAAQLQVTAATADGGELASKTSAYLNGSYRCTMQTTGVYGTVAGFFYYFSGTEEIDIEILSRQNASPLMHCTVHLDSGDTHKYVPLDFDPSAAFHEYRFDWYSLTDPGALPRVEFFVDGVLRATIIESIPTTPGSIIVNHWSTVGASWADGLTAANAALKVASITKFY